MPIHRNIKNVVHNYTEVECKVREATSNDPWGPNATLMNEIADHTYNVISVTEIMQMIWRRINDNGKNWRHVYKGLILLEYLIKVGSDQVAQQSRLNLDSIRILKTFNWTKNGKDFGNYVRSKASDIENLLSNEDFLKDERVKALSVKNRQMGSMNTYETNVPSYSKSSLNDNSHESPSHLYTSVDRASLNNYEVETNMPQSSEEEKLHLKIALALSKKEHEQQEQVRLQEILNEEAKLQLVIEQSRKEVIPNTNGHERHSATTSQSNSGTMDLVNLSQNVPVVEPSLPDTSTNGGALFNLVDTSLSVAPAGEPDPWNVSSSASNLPLINMHSVLPNNVSTAPVSMQPVMSGAPLVYAQQTTSTQNTPQPLAITASPSAAANQATDPWGAIVAVTDQPAPQSTQTAAEPAVQHITNDIWSLQNNLNMLSLQAASGSSGQSTSAAQDQMGASVNKDPAAFLGEHKGLVDLDKLVERKPQTSNPFDSTVTTASSIIAAAQGSSRAAAGGGGSNPFQPAVAQQLPTPLQAKPTATCMSVVAHHHHHHNVNQSQQPIQLQQQHPMNQPPRSPAALPLRSPDRTLNPFL